MKMRFYCALQPFSRGIDLHIGSEDGDSRYAVSNLTFHRVDQGEIVSPCASIRVEEAQELMDQLWNCGLRPSEGAGSAGSLAATENHLIDMRAIAFGLLKKSGVEFEA